MAVLEEVLVTRDGATYQTTYYRCPNVARRRLRDTGLKTPSNWHPIYKLEVRTGDVPKVDPETKSKYQELLQHKPSANHSVAKAVAFIADLPASTVTSVMSGATSSEERLDSIRRAVDQLSEALPEKEVAPVAEEAPQPVPVHQDAEQAQHLVDQVEAEAPFRERLSPYYIAEQIEDLVRQLVENNAGYLAIVACNRAGLRL